MRRGIVGCLEMGSHITIGLATAELAAALARQGGMVEALETVEQALRANPEGLVTSPRISADTWRITAKTGSGGIG